MIGTMVNSENPNSITLNGNDFEIIKPVRLRGGMVVKAGNIYGRIGPKLETLEEQIHTVSLLERGFPVAQIIDSGAVGDDMWFFTESSLGDTPFHELFSSEYSTNEKISDSTFNQYLDVIRHYSKAQSTERNYTTVSAEDFVSSLLPRQLVIHNYDYFGYDVDQYENAIKRATQRLERAPMGILQFDLNPYNTLRQGVIDFEAVGYGPIGYDTLMSARWGGGWFPNYPARHTMAYRLSNQQIAENDTLVNGMAKQNRLEEPTIYLNEFLLLKTAWASSDILPVTSDMPIDRIEFRRYRAKLLDVAVNSYLAGKPIPYDEFRDIKA